MKSTKTYIIEKSNLSLEKQGFYYNVQILIDNYYSGNGKFCKTLKEVLEYLSNEIDFIKILERNRQILYKKENRIICYINCFNDKFIVCTGKPSDHSCIAWTYDNLKSAKNTAAEYYINYINTIQL